MRRRISLILAVIMLVTCAGCFMGVENDRRGYGDRDRGSHDSDRHDDRRGHDDRR